mgnify:CR=1 FL=1
MINTLHIGKLIYSRLTENEELNQHLNNKVYPLVADNNVTFPYAVYQRNSVISTYYNKDGIVEDDCNFSIMIVCASYEESIELANLVRDIFTAKSIITDYLSIYNCRLSDAYEDYSSNSYIQRLNFTCKTTNN